ncbi:WAT1-related protein At1g68170 [Jatropha curcas]|uniref:WAT1-related protein At1g68170 n=1 Tax=Jatropha curcas TaxID=180498 RepID=UPI00189331C4|nr:WAT1-related protein At1g68170 [Jatropha curcas]
MTNLVPVMTLILAAAFGLEKLKLRTITGKAKLIGTIIGIGGAMLITFYQGVEVKIWSTNINLLKHSHNDELHQKSHNLVGNRIVGSVLALGSCITIALWMIIQTKMSKRYPCHYSSTALMSLMASIQSVILSLCIKRNWNEWKLGWNIRLLTVAYSGIVTSGFVVTLIAWCVNLRGPVFVVSFNPTCLVIVAIAGSLFLEEKLHLGSILGGLVIVCGLYVVLWGQNKEIKEKARQLPTNEQVEVATNGDNSTVNASSINMVFWHSYFLVFWNGWSRKIYRNRKAWFNSMGRRGKEQYRFSSVAWGEDKMNSIVKTVTFRDGNPLPGEIIRECLKIIVDESVAIPW